jgi:hypothetical protein
MDTRFVVATTVCMGASVCMDASRGENRSVFLPAINVVADDGTAHFVRNHTPFSTEEDALKYAEWDVTICLRAMLAYLGNCGYEERT